MGGPLSLRALLPTARRCITAQRYPTPAIPAPPSLPVRLPARLPAQAGLRLRLGGACRGGVESSLPKLCTGLPYLASASPAPLAVRSPTARRLSSGPQGRMDAVGACREYVEKSNEHMVEECLAMFAPDAVYGSTTVGGHKGIDAISTMMRGFFQKCPKVHWAVADGGYKLAPWRGPLAVEFEFVRTGVNDSEGRPTRQEGTEWVHFVDGEGGLRISQVEVEVKSTSVLE